MGMLVFISKAPERSLHYESRSKSPGLLTFLGWVAGPTTLCAWGSEKDFSQILSAEMRPPTSTYCFPPYGFKGSEHGLIGRKHLSVRVRSFFYEFFLLNPPATFNEVFRVASHLAFAFMLVVEAYERAEPFGVLDTDSIPPIVAECFNAEMDHPKHVENVPDQLTVIGIERFSVTGK